MHHLDPWPALPYDGWRDTCATLHLWSQIVGKIRLTKTPWLNHSWHVALYVDARRASLRPSSLTAAKTSSCGSTLSTRYWYAT